MNHIIKIISVLTMSLFITGAAIAQDEAKAPEWLFVHTAETATMLNPTTLEMPADRDIFAFTDRPNRMHAYLTAIQFAALWDAGDGDTFLADPPNAVLTWVEHGEVKEQEVVITLAVVGTADDDNVITYTLAESMVGVPTSIENASLFIDSMIHCTCSIPLSVEACAPICVGYYCS